MNTILLQALIVGMMATSVMTGFLYLSSWVLAQRLQVIHILGTMLTMQTTKNKGLSGKWSALLIGTIVHYIIGFGFALVYLLLCERSRFNFTIGSTLIFGFLIGLIAVLAWGLFIKLHPDPPFINTSYYLFFIFVSHLVFGLGISCAYVLFIE